ncbi:MAG TPA: choice-of-anchor R domain-containing protein [Anaerolineaceae bacterium]|nr:choice-of-anchor R domain-containing protein [Anaerolineaceae bacterium]
MLTAKIKNRDFTERADLDWLRLVVARMSWAGMGGPDEAELAAEGPELALWELVELLRYPVEIWDTEKQELAWWGYVERAKVWNEQDLAASVALEGMANRIAVTFSSLTPGLDLVNGRYTTSWADNADSQTAYGVKELLVSQVGSTAAAAQVLRDKVLDQRKYPGVEWSTGQQVASSLGQQGNSVPITKQPGAQLLLRGWWHTLDWLYWANPAGRETFEYGGTQDWFGAQWADWAYSQPFSTPAGSASWLCDRVQLRLKKIGSPADNVIVQLCADSGGNPGTVLGSGSLAGGGISWNMRLEEVLISPVVAIAPATTYHIQVKRSNAAPDGYHYFMLDTYTGGSYSYPRGNLLVYATNAWQQHPQPAWMWFKVLGAQETTAQIAAAAARQTLIAAVDLDAASGVSTNQYRIGDHKVKIEIEAWAKIGTAAGRQLLARVRENRRLWVYEEPAPGVKDWGLLKSGEVRNEFDQAVPEWRDCSGVWLGLRDVLPGTVNVQRLADAKRIFVARCGWSLGKGRWIEAR